MNLKIYNVEFSPLYPVPSGLMIAAENLEQAEEMARNQIMHTKDIRVFEIELDKPKILFYESGDY